MAREVGREGWTGFQSHGQVGLLFYKSKLVRGILDIFGVAH